MGRCSTIPSNHEDQGLEDVRTKEGAMERNCWASQDPFWVVELLQKKNYLLLLLLWYLFILYVSFCVILVVSSCGKYFVSLEGNKRMCFIFSVKKVKIIPKVCAKKTEPVNNRKFWQELISYFPLTLHGPHRKRKNRRGDTARWSHKPNKLGGYTAKSSHKLLFCKNKKSDWNFTNIWRDSSITGYWLFDQGSVPDRSRIFFIPMTTKATYHIEMANGGFLLRGKATGTLIWQPTFRLRRGGLPPLLPFASMAWHRDPENKKCYPLTPWNDCSLPAV
jgi:hypothetical protein